MRKRQVNDTFSRFILMRVPLHGCCLAPAPTTWLPTAAKSQQESILTYLHSYGRTLCPDGIQSMHIVDKSFPFVFSIQLSVYQELSGHHIIERVPFCEKNPIIENRIVRDLRMEVRLDEEAFCVS